MGDKARRPRRKLNAASGLASSAAAPEFLALLRPYPPDAMRAYPVSTVVNSPRNATPECIEPVA